MKVVGNWKEGTAPSEEQNVLQNEKEEVLRPIGNWKEAKALPPEEKPSYATPEIEGLLRETGDVENAMRVSQGNLQWALRVTRGTSPEAAADVQRLAKQLQMPEDTVERNLGQVKDLAKSQEVIKHITQRNDKGDFKYPYTLNWLGKKDAMTLAKDDVQALAEIEQQLHKRRQRGEGFFKQLYRATQVGFNNFNVSVAELPALLHQGAAYPFNKIAEVTNTPELRMDLPEFLQGNPVTKYYQEMTESVRPHTMDEDTLKLISDHEYGKAAQSIALQSASNLPNLIALAAVGVVNPVAGLTTAGTLEAATSLETDLKNGKDPAKAFEAATLKGIAEGFFEKYTLDLLFKPIAKQATKQIGKEGAKELIKRTAGIMLGTGGAAAIEGQSEAATSIAQDLADYITGDKDALEGSVSRAFNSFMVGAFTGATISGSQNVQMEVSRRAKYQEDLQAHEGVVAALESTKIKELSPEKTADFIKTNTLENDKIFIPNEAVTALFQEDPDGYDDFLKEMGVKDQVKDAETTNADLEVPYSKFVAKYAGTDIETSLRPDLRFDLDGLSQNDLEKRQEVSQLVDELQAEYADLIEQEKNPQQLEAIRQTLMNPKKKGGFGMTAEEADTNVAVFLAGASTLSRESGENMQQWFDRVNPSLLVGGTPVTGPGVLEQAVSREKLFHGTSKEFIEFERQTKKGVEKQETLQPIFFSADEAFAKQYSQGTTGRVIEVSIDPSAKIWSHEEGGFNSDTDTGFNAFEEKLLASGLSDQAAYDFAKSVLDRNWDAIESSEFQEYLNESEYDGFETQEDGVKNVGILNTDVIEQKEPEARVLEQGKKRGAIEFKETETLIHLFKDANYSTFLHETGHLFMREMEQLVDKGQASEQTQKDLATLQEFVADEKDFRGQQEKLARGFEAYLREGKAPSIKLANAFEKMRSWLTAIYRSMKGLNVEINDEVRGVFDRLLSTQKEIDEVQTYYKAKKSLAERLEGATKKQVDNGKKKNDKAKMSAIEKQAKKNLAAYLRAIGGKKELAKQAEKEVNKLPVYKVVEEGTKFGGVDLYGIEQIVGEKAAKEVTKKFPGLAFEDQEFKATNFAEKIGKTYRSLVLDRGGINPNSVDSTEFKLAAKESGLLRIFSKKGRGLDVVAEELIEDGFLTPPENMKATDYLMELLLERAFHNQAEIDNAIAEEQFDFGPQTTLSELAIENDFNSEEALVQSLVEADSKSKAIEKRTGELLQEKEASILEELSRDETIPGEESYHGDARLDYLISQAKMLQENINKKRKAEGETVTLSESRFEKRVINDVAKTKVRSKPVREGRVYSKFSQAEQRAANQAVLLTEQGDLIGAHDAVQLQIVNHAMVNESVKVRELSSKIENSYKSNRIKSKLNSTEDAYAKAASKLIGHFKLNSSEDFQNVSAPSLQELDEVLWSTTPTWILEGNLPNGFKDYKDLTFNQLEELDAAIKSIMHVGRDQLASIDDARYQTFSALRDASVAEMSQLKDKQVFDEFSKKGAVLNKISGMMAQAEMNEFIFERLDNYKFTKTETFGPMRTMYNRYVKAETEYEANKSKVIEQSAKPHLNVLAKAAKRLEQKYGDVAFQIPGVPLTDDMKRRGRFGWTAERIITFTLNLGNLGNRQALDNSYSYTQAQVDLITSQLTAEELQAVQGMWDSTNLLFDDLNKTHFSMYNRNLEKVEAPVEGVKVKAASGDVTLKGGYYPLSFDHQLNTEAAKQKAKKEENADLMSNRNNNVFRKTKPEDGSTYSRTPGHSLPPNLSLSVWYEHIDDVSRYISHAEYLRDMNRLTLDPEWLDMVDLKAGKPIYNEIRGSISYQALPERRQPSGLIGRFFEGQRNLATVAILGANLAVGVKQRLSMFSAAKRIGWNNIYQGAKIAGLGQSTLGLNGYESWQKVIELSPYMKIRANNIDRELTDSRNKLSPKVKQFDMFGKSFTRDDIKNFMFEWIQMNDRATVGVIWNGAFNKAMQERIGQPEQQRIDDSVLIADELIRTTQPSSLPGDLNSLQRDEGLMRLFTSFMTYTFKYGNINIATMRAWKDGAISNTEFFRHMIYDTFLPAWGNLLISSAFADGDLPEWWEFATAPMSQWISWIPIIRDIPSMIKFRQPAGSSVAFEGINRAVKAGEDAYGAIRGDKEWAKALWSLGRAAEFQAGVPALKVVKDIQRQYKNATKRD